MKCFLCALRGIAKTVKDERNMRVHLCFAFYVVMAGLVTKAARGEWLALLLSIAAVISLECVNTAIERLCDTLHPEKSSAIGFVKDAAAGAVLVFAISSAIIGGLIFVTPEKLSAAYAFLIKFPVPSALIILTLVPAVLFVRGKFKGENQ